MPDSTKLGAPPERKQQQRWCVTDANTSTGTTTPT